MDAHLPIRLNPDDSASLCKELNALLCDLHVFYQNVRGFHWNVQGQNFFELHAKFEEIYTDLQVKIDEVDAAARNAARDPAALERAERRLAVLMLLTVRRAKRLHIACRTNIRCRLQGSAW